LGESSSGEREKREGEKNESGQWMNDPSPKASEIKDTRAEAQKATSKANNDRKKIGGGLLRERRGG